MLSIGRASLAGRRSERGDHAPFVAAGQPTIIKLLRDRPDQPVTVGVRGDLGAGKSSVLELIETGFEGEAKVLCLNCTAWADPEAGRRGQGRSGNVGADE